MSALPPNWTTEAVPGTLSKRHDVLLTSERQRAMDTRTADEAKKEEEREEEWNRGQTMREEAANNLCTRRRHRHRRRRW